MNESLKLHHWMAYICSLYVHVYAMHINIGLTLIIPWTTAYDYILLNQRPICYCCILFQWCGNNSKWKLKPVKLQRHQYSCVRLRYYDDDLNDDDYDEDISTRFVFVYIQKEIKKQIFKCIHA